MFTISKIFYGGFPDALAAASASIINRPVTQSDESITSSQANTSSRIIDIIRANRDSLFESTQNVNELGSQNQAANNGRNNVDIMEKARADIERMKLQLAKRKVRVHSDFEVQRAALRDILARGAHLRANTRKYPDVDRCVNTQQSDQLIDETPPFECLDYATATTAHALGNQNQVVSSGHDCEDIMETARAAIKRMKLQLAKRKVRVHSDFEVQRAALRDILTRGAHSRSNTRAHPDVDRCVNIKQSDLLTDETPPFECLGYAIASTAATSPTTTAHALSNQNQAANNGSDCVDIMDKARAAIKRMKLQLAKRKVRVHSDFEVQRAALRDILTRGAHSRSNTREHPDVDRCVNIKQSDLLTDETPPFECLGYAIASTAATSPTTTAHALGNQNQAANNGRNNVDIMEKARADIERMKLQLAKRKVRVHSDFEVQRAALRDILARGAHSRSNTREHPDVDRCVNTQQSDQLIDETPPFQN